MSLRILDGDGLDQRIKDDPRWSESQREAALKAAQVDPDARCLGLDARMRPVLTVKLRGGVVPSKYAVLRNGAPAKPKEPMAERWRSTPRRNHNTRSTS
jgi:hypothetical protein